MLILRDAYEAEKQEKESLVYALQCARKSRERKKKEMQRCRGFPTTFRNLPPSRTIIT